MTAVNAKIADLQSLLLPPKPPMLRLYDMGGGYPYGKAIGHLCTSAPNVKGKKR